MKTISKPAANGSCSICGQRGYLIYIRDGKPIYSHVKSRDAEKPYSHKFKLTRRNGRNV